MGIHDGHRMRVRNRFLSHGLDTLEDHEVLELLLFYVIHRQDTNELAHELLHRFGSLEAVMDASYSELTQVKGIGEQAATLLLLAKPLSRRYLLSQNDDKQPLNSVRRCADYLIPYFFGAKEEHVFLLCLDAKSRPICCRELSEGSATATELPIRKATKLALDSKAVSVVLAHNHPGGEPTPSQDDYDLTALLRDTLQSVGVLLLDHIVMTGTNFVSLRESGFFY